MFLNRNIRPLLDTLNVYTLMSNVPRGSDVRVPSIPPPIPGFSPCLVLGQHLFFFFFFNTFIDELFPVYLKFVLLLKSQPVLIECLRSRPQPLFSRCALFHAEMITYRHQNRGVSLRCTKMGLLLHGVLPLAFLI